jgi:hypothetical protein
VLKGGIFWSNFVDLGLKLLISELKWPDRIAFYVLLRFWFLRIVGLTFNAL